MTVLLQDHLDRAFPFEVLMDQRCRRGEELQLSEGLYLENAMVLLAVLRMEI
jgi:hypothetical protein